MITHASCRHTRSLRPQDGIALMSTIMVTVMLSALLVGFTAMIASEARMGGLDITAADSFYAAHAGLEKLTSELGALFATDFSPSGDQVRALENAAPSLDGVTWMEPDGSSGYRIDFTTTTGNPANGDPVAQNQTATCQLIKVTLVEIAWQLPPDQGHAVKRRRGKA